MAVDKNFVVKHGLEVNGDLILANALTNRVGIATTVPNYTLHVNGGIGATDLKVLGIATIPQLVLTGTVKAANSIGLPEQYLKSTGSGVEWEDFPVGRTSGTFTASPGQTTFSFTYSVGLVDIFINGVKLTPSEFTATDAVSIVLTNPCFGGEVVDIHAYSVRGLGVGATGITGLTIQDEGIIIGNPQGVTSINFVGVGLTASATGAAVTVSLADQLTNQWNTTSVGINTLKNVGIGTTNPRFSLEVGPVGYADTALWVNGNARVTGILTVGTSSIVLNGSTNTLTVPNLVVTNSTTGVTASGIAITVRDNDVDLGTASIINFGDNLSVTFSSGIATITGSAGGGSSSQWVSTTAGIHTLSNVGIGTTNPTSALTVKGNTSLESLNVSGVSTFTNSINLNTGNLKVATDGIIKIGNSDQLELYYTGSGGQTIKSTGDLRILTNRLLLNNSTNDEQLIEANQNGSVVLYYDNSKKFETIGAGVTVTGTTFTNQLSVSGVSTFAGFTYLNSDMKVADYQRILFGNNANLTIGYDASESMIKNQTSAPFAIDLGSNNNSKLSIRVGSGNTLAYFTRTNVELYESFNKKFETIGSGVTVTGTTFTNQLNVSGVSTFSGNVGIGTTNPLSGNALTVAGITTTNGLYVSGISTFNDNIEIGDLFSTSKLIRLGGSGYLQYNQPNITLSTIYDSGKVILKGSSGVEARTSNDQLVAYFADNPGNIGYVELYHQGSKKFETIGAGVTVTGTTFTNELGVSGISTFNNYLKLYSGISFYNDLQNSAGATNNISVVSGVTKRMLFRGNTINKFSFSDYYGGSDHYVFEITKDGDLTASGNLSIAGISTFSYIQNTGITSTKDLIVYGTGNDSGSISTMALMSRTNYLDFGPAIPNTSAPQSFALRLGSDRATGTFGPYSILQASWTNPSGSVSLNNWNGTGGISISDNGVFAETKPVIIGTATSTGTASQRLQVTGGAYVSGSVGIGTTNPTSSFTVRGNTSLETLNVSGISTFGGSSYFGGTSNFGTTEIISSGEIKLNNLSRIMFGYSGSTPNGLVIRNNSSSNLSEIVQVGGGDISIKADSGRKVIIGNNSNILSVSGIGITVVGNTSTDSLYVSDSVGIGTLSATSKLTVRGGDISVGVSTSHGVILTSPNGTQYRLIVANDGTLSTTAV